MVAVLQAIINKLKKSKFLVVEANLLNQTTQAIQADYTNSIAVALAEAIAYTNANVNAVLPQTDSYPNTSGGAWGTLIVNLSTGVINVSKGGYISGKLNVSKNGQVLILGTDFTETSPSTGVFTMAVFPLFSNDIIVAQYNFVTLPVSI